MIAKDTEKSLEESNPVIFPLICIPYMYVMYTLYIFCQALWNGNGNGNGNPFPGADRFNLTNHKFSSIDMTDDRRIDRDKLSKQHTVFLLSIYFLDLMPLIQRI